MECDVITSGIQSQDCVCNSESINHGDCMNHSVSHLQYESCLTSQRIKCKRSFSGNEESRNTKLFKENFCSFFSVRQGIQRCFCHQNWIVFRTHSQFCSPSTVPYCFHVVPIFHNSVFDRMCKCKNSSLDLCFTTHVELCLMGFVEISEE